MIHYEEPTRSSCLSTNNILGADPNASWRAADILPVDLDCSCLVDHISITVNIIILERERAGPLQQTKKEIHSWPACPFLCLMVKVY